MTFHDQYYPRMKPALFCIFDEWQLLSITLLASSSGFTRRLALTACSRLADSRKPLFHHPTRKRGVSHSLPVLPTFLCLLPQCSFISLRTGPTFYKLRVDEFLCQVDPSLSLELITAVPWQVSHPQGDHEALLICVCQHFRLAGQHPPTEHLQCFPPQALCTC